MNVLGIKFAPFLIPLERRLQTTAVFFWSSWFLFFAIGGMVFSVFLCFTKYYFIPLLYALWFCYDHQKCSRGGRRSNFFRRLIIWNWMRDYFPISLIKTADLDPKKNYIFGYHPHGIMCAGAFCNFATEATKFGELFPGIKAHLLTLEGQFWAPFHREFIMLSGLCAASRNSFKWILTKQGTGNAAIIVVGGAMEALDAHPKQVTLTLRRRKGFVRLALRHGASLVPVFSFGENDIFWQLPNPEGSFLRKIQIKTKNILGFSPALINARGLFQYNFGYVPYRTPIHTVVGKPIDVEKAIENPTDKEIDDLHEKYVSSLQELFEEYKVKLGDEHKNLLLKIT